MFLAFFSEVFCSDLSRRKKDCFPWIDKF